MAGSQLKWYRSVIPILEDYFRQTDNLADVAQGSNGSSPETEASNQTNNKANTKTKKAWTVAERLKEKDIKSNPDQIQLIQSFADEYYTEKHGTKPPKLTNRKIPVSSYPGEESIELIDKAIDTVLNPRKKTDAQM